MIGLLQQRLFNKRTFLILLVILLACGCGQNYQQDETERVSNDREDASQSFQEYLWYQNADVLLLQVALMISGAIGVSALLPAPDEEKTNK